LTTIIGVQIILFVILLNVGAIGSYGPDGMTYDIADGTPTVPNGGPDDILLIIGGPKCF
jgi:hypothetical protein